MRTNGYLPSCGPKKGWGACGWRCCNLDGCVRPSSGLPWQSIGGSDCPNAPSPLSLVDENSFCFQRQTALGRNACATLSCLRLVGGIGLGCHGIPVLEAVVNVSDRACLWLHRIGVLGLSREFTVAKTCLFILPRLLDRTHLVGLAQASSVGTLAQPTYSCLGCHPLWQGHR